MQHRCGHATWTWAYSMDVDMDMDMHMDMDMDMVMHHRQVMLHVHVHVRAAYPCTCCVHMSMLNVPVHAVWPCPGCVSESILLLHVHAALSLCFFSMSMLNVQAILHVYVHAASARPCYVFISMLHIPVHAACRCPGLCMLQVSLRCSSMSMLHIQAHEARTWTCSRDMDKQHVLGNAAWTRHAAWTWTRMM
jgi:hypothetical protein